jgi:pimeloyl-ACP methyl ester carboxylesterase
VTDPSAILGAGVFLGVSGGLLWGGAVCGVALEAMRPERRTIGWALARGGPTEPGHWGLPAREWSHQHRGSSCPAFDLGDDDPGAPTAIVVHGFARSRYDALARLGPILPHARRFILPDLPGHGDASGRGTRLGADEDAFLESLITTVTTGPVLLVGHSLGATIALQAAGREPLAARVRGVLALAPYERLRTPLGARLDLRGMPKAALLGPTVRLLGAFGVRERSTREAAARVACPVAVLAGELDLVTPLDEARAIAESAATSRFRAIPYAQHDDFHTVGRTEMESSLAWIDSCG